jgi:glycosyltransferase involved in cell wall biosynthesis
MALKIIFFTFYYPPDLCAGSFRAVALVQALSKKLNSNHELHIITTHPNRYASHKAEAKDIESSGKVTIHRIKVPKHQSGMFSQAYSFGVYAILAYRLCKKINPTFLIGTTSRLMTGVLTGFSAHQLGCRYFIDLRDIFSESISDIFSLKNRILGGVSKKIFFFFERKLLNSASGVNVVSKGFLEYFQKEGMDTSKWSFFPNGVDREFTKLTNSKNTLSKKNKTILYAGNIGGGQGLEYILPNVAKKIGNNYHFLVIGDGGMRLVLEERLKYENINNVEILPPVKREKLIKYYQDADILFLHLNNIPALRRVLPSKIFEYTALKKPIIAGLDGYSANFLKDNNPNAILFNPGNVIQCINSIKKAESLKINEDNMPNFIEKYARERIMENMASHILSIV